MNESTVQGEDAAMSPPVSGREAIKLFMRGIVRDEEDGFIEVRTEAPGGGMHPKFFPVTEIETAVEYVSASGDSGTFAGMGVRTRREGNADAVTKFSGFHTGPGHRRRQGLRRTWDSVSE